VLRCAAQGRQVAGEEIPRGQSSRFLCLIWGAVLCCAAQGGQVAGGLLEECGEEARPDRCGHSCVCVCVCVCVYVSVCVNVCI